MHVDDRQLQHECDESPQRRGIWNRIHIPIAAAAALASVAGITLAVLGLIQFNNTKTITGVVIIVVSTIIYVTILACDRNSAET